MCGLYGFLTIEDTILTPKQRNARFKAAKKLAFANEARGTDSSGFAYRAKDSDTISTLKIVGSSHHLLADKRAREAMRRAKTNLLIGHTRFATTGAVTVPNAHPYAYGDIVGAHNGWLTNHTTLANKHKLKYEVDSQLIFQLLQARKNDYTSVINELMGPAALTYTDVKTRNLYLLRHNNPLSVVYLPWLKTYMWSSQENHLDQATRHIHHIQELELDNDEVVEIQPNGQFNITQMKLETKSSVYNYPYSSVYSTDLYDYDDEETLKLDAWGYCDWCDLSTTKEKLTETGYGKLCKYCKNKL